MTSSFMQRIKTKFSNLSRRKESLNESKNVTQVTTKTPNTSCEAEQDLPALLIEAYHSPEVLGVRSSLNISDVGFMMKVIDAVKAPPLTNFVSEDTTFVNVSSPTTRTPSTATTFSSCVSAKTATPICTPFVGSDTVPALCSSDFKRVKVAGCGGFGIVYVTEHIPTKKRVALKVLSKSSNRRTNVLREHKALMALTTGTNTRGIIKTYGCFHNTNNYFFATEYYSGGEFGDEVRRWRKMPQKLVQHYAAEMLLSIRSVHRQGWVHRDIKPENFFLDSERHVILGDFGLAECVNSSSKVSRGDVAPMKLHGVFGTWQYMAPEVYTKEGYGYAADVWSFGVTVFCMLLGRTPWKCEKHVDVFEAKHHTLNGSFDAWIDGESVDPIVHDFLRRLLIHNQSRRMTLDEAMSHPFFNGISWEALSKGEVSVPDVGSPPSPRILDCVSLGLLGRFFCRIGLGSTYVEGEDPHPSFNFASPTSSW